MENLIKGKKIPIFVAPRINADAVFEKYNKGYFTKEIEKQRFLLKSNNIFSNVGKSIHDEDRIFRMITKNDVHYATSNHENFAYQEKEKKLKKGGVCQYHLCGKKFEDYILGVPIGYECKRIAKKNTKKEGDYILRTLHCFHIEGEFCSFQHTLLFINEIKKENYDATLKNSVNYLKFLFSILYPGEILDLENGKLSSNIPHKNVKLLAVKVDYIKLDDEKPIKLGVFPSFKRNDQNYLRTSNIILPDVKYI